MKGEKERMRCEGVRRGWGGGIRLKVMDILRGIRKEEGRRREVREGGQTLGNIRRENEEKLTIGSKNKVT